MNSQLSRGWQTGGLFQCNQIEVWPAPPRGYSHNKLAWCACQLNSHDCQTTLDSHPNALLSKTAVSVKNSHKMKVVLGRVGFNGKLNQLPKVFWSEREIGRIFSIKMHNFKLWKMPELFNLRFPEGWYFLNCDSTELKRSSKIFFFVSERHRQAIVG